MSACPVSASRPWQDGSTARIHHGSGDRGTAVFRIRYSDDSSWWAITIYGLRDGRISQSRGFFAPDFEAPDWRAPCREAP